MNFTLNGKPYIHNGNGTLTALLQEIRAEQEQVAIMINNEITKAQDRSSISLQDGDQIEIITYAAGG